MRIFFYIIDMIEYQLLKDAPYCASNGQVYGVAAGESVTVSCLVASRSAEILRFHWRLNGTRLPANLQSPARPLSHNEYFNNPNQRFGNERRFSNELLLQEPVLANDEQVFAEQLRLDTKLHPLGVLECWAENEIGSQEEPCVHQIIAAGM